MLLQRIEEAFVVFQESVELLPCQGIGLLAHDAQARISPALNEAPLVEGLLGHSRHACGDHTLLLPCQQVMLLHLVASQVLLCRLIHRAVDLSKLGHLLIPLDSHTEVKTISRCLLLLCLVDRFGHQCLCLHLLGLEMCLSLRLRGQEQ